MLKSLKAQSMVTTDGFKTVVQVYYLSLLMIGFLVNSDVVHRTREVLTGLQSEASDIEDGVYVEHMG